MDYAPLEASSSKIPTTIELGQLFKNVYEVKQLVALLIIVFLITIIIMLMY